MTRNPTFSRFVICVVLLSFTTACSTTRQLEATDSESLVSQLAVGDKVKVARTDGSRLNFKVSDISPDGLHGGEVYVPFTDIAGVKISEPATTSMIVFYVALGAVAAWMLKEGVDCGELFNPCPDD